MLSVKQGSCEYQFYGHWFDPTRNQIRVYSSRDGRYLPLGHLNCKSPVRGFVTNYAEITTLRYISQNIDV